tara:strand:+ start:207 stop:326 length:120 start_codon:yes stop_codon:yes gene_type:complete
VEAEANKEQAVVENVFLRLGHVFFFRLVELQLVVILVQE